MDPNAEKQRALAAQQLWDNFFFLAFVAMPSLSVTLLLRRRVGYRMIRPNLLMFAFFGLSAMGWASLLTGGLTGDLFNPSHFVMMAAAIAVTGSGIYWRHRAWQDIKRGVRWHTKSRGISYLSKILPLPESIIQRFVEPILCFVVGIFSVPIISLPLGIWLIVSGVALAAHESAIHEMQLNNMLDQLDGIVEGEVAADNHAFFTQDNTSATGPTIEQMAGSTVAFTPELLKQITLRRAAVEAREAAIDNQDIADSIAAQVKATEALSAAKAEDHTVFDAAIEGQSGHQE